MITEPTEKNIYTQHTIYECYGFSNLTYSPDKKFLVFIILKYDEKTKKMTRQIQCLSTDDTSEKKTPIPLTEESDINSDSNPCFSESFPDKLFFLRREGDKNNLVYINFSPLSQKDKKEFEVPKKLTNYPINIKNILFQKKTLMFSADVYFNQNMEFTKEKDSKIDKSYIMFTRTMIRHWGSYYIDDKCSHPFIQKVKLDENNNLILEGEPIDMLYNIQAVTPPVEMTAEQFSISPNEKYVAFSVHLRNREHSWNTNFDIFFYDIENKKLKNITEGKVPGKCLGPKFKYNSKKLAFMYMENPNFKHDPIHFMVYDIEKDSLEKTNEEIEKETKISILGYCWDDSKYMNDDEDRFLVECGDDGKRLLYRVFLQGKTYEETYKKLNNDMISNNSFFTFNDRIFSHASSYTFPCAIYEYKYDEKDKMYHAIKFYDPNEDKLKDYYLQEPENFYYTGTNNTIIQGYLFHPIKKEKGKKYPMLFYIHGGPEGFWCPKFAYDWNPQIFANQGYYVVCINPHGSFGKGSKFQRSVIGDWGGKPYRDLIFGFYYLKSLSINLPDKYPIDYNLVGASGGSYGGFMINWIQGHNDENIFKCLICKGGIFNSISFFYSTDEIWYPMSEFGNGKNECFPFTSEENRRKFDEMSPERFVNKWKTPQLIVHGGKDFRTDFSEAIATFNALQLKGVPSKLLYFPNESHWSLKPENSIKWYEESINWLNKFLKK